MLKFTDIDFNAVWQETFGWNAAGDTDNRKFNDQAENDFWVRLAPRYTQEYNLNHDTSLFPRWFYSCPEGRPVYRQLGWYRD